MKPQPSLDSQLRKVITLLSREKGWAMGYDENEKRRSVRDLKWALKETGVIKSAKEKG